MDDDDVHVPLDRDAWRALPGVFAFTMIGALAMLFAIMP